MAYQKKYGTYSSAFGAGIVGAVTMTILMVIARAMGLTTMNLEMMLGSMITSTFGTGTWVLGFAWHVINGGVFALIYAAGFKQYGKANVTLGAAFGFVHWIVAGIFMGLLPAMHPLIPVALSAPGYFAASTGVFNFFAELVMHLIYGGIVGAIYQDSADQGRIVAPPQATAVDIPERKRFRQVP